MANESVQRNVEHASRHVRNSPVKICSFTVSSKYCIIRSQSRIFVFEILMRNFPTTCVIWNGTRHFARRAEWNFFPPATRNRAVPG